MNWEIAKNWLIAAFLLLDLFLGWQVYQGRQALVGYVESYSDLVANTKTVLSEHGLILDTTVPTTHPDLPFLQAGDTTPELTQLMQTAFPAAQSYTVDVQSGVGTCPEGTVKILEKGSWQIDYALQPALPTSNDAAAWSMVWRFSDYIPDPANPFLPKPAHVQEIRQYVQKYESYPMFDASLTVDVNNGRILGYTQTNLNSISAVGDPKPTITALDALDNLANTVDKTASPARGNRILKVTLGYVHKTPQNPEDNASPTAPYWYPVWRVVTSQRVYYINAFTGEVDLPS